MQVSLVGAVPDGNVQRHVSSSQRPKIGVGAQDCYNSAICGISSKSLLPGKSTSNKVWYRYMIVEETLPAVHTSAFTFSVLPLQLNNSASVASGGYPVRDQSINCPRGYILQVNDTEFKLLTQNW